MSFAVEDKDLKRLLSVFLGELIAEEVVHPIGSSAGQRQIEVAILIKINPMGAVVAVIILYDLGSDVYKSAFIIMIKIIFITSSASNCTVYIKVKAAVIIVITPGSGIATVINGETQLRCDVGEFCAI